MKEGLAPVEGTQRSLFAEPFFPPKARKGRGKRGAFHVAGMARCTRLRVKSVVLLQLERIQGQDRWLVDGVGTKHLDGLGA